MWGERRVLASVGVGALLLVALSLHNFGGRGPETRAPTQPLVAQPVAAVAQPTAAASTPAAAAPAGQPAASTTAKWVGLLSGRPESAPYWVEGKIPPEFTSRPSRWGARGTCPSALSEPTMRQSAPFCLEYWPSPPAGRQCVIYSIGIGDVWGWEDKIADRYSCAIEAYDPTRNLRAKHEAHAHPRVRFHYAGLGATRNNVTAAAAAQRAEAGGGAAGSGTMNWYGEVDPRVLTTLEDMVDADRRRGAVDVLKVDCEGCEWAAFEQIARDSPGLLDGTSVVMLEVHITPTLIAPTAAQFDGLFDFLVTRQGFRLWYMRNNVGYKRDRHVVDFLARHGAKPDQCCYELAFVRPRGARE